MLIAHADPAASADRHQAADAGRPVLLPWRKPAVASTRARWPMVLSAMVQIGVLCLSGVVWRPVAAEPIAVPPTLPAASAPESDLLAPVHRWLADHPATAAAPAGRRLNVVVGTPDRRLRLAPCTKTEVVLPSGARLWGHTHVTVRCLEGGTHWSVFVPLDVQVWGRGLLARTSLPAGSVLTAGDVVEGEVDLAADAATALPPSTDGLAGRTLQRPLDAGQAVRQSHLKARSWFAAGDVVKVVASGDGYSVSGEGTAMTPGIEGVPARVRTESGRVVTGMPTARQLLELPL